MSYQRRIPPIKLELSIDNFNFLIETLNINTTITNEKVKNISIKLKDKLLKYSIPREDGEHRKYIDIRFYPNESSEIIEILIMNLEKLEISSNYYDILLNNRENIKVSYNDK